MKKIKEDSYLKIRALAYAIDDNLQQIVDSDSIHYENAAMLSEIIIKEFEKVDNEDEQ